MRGKECHNCGRPSGDDAYVCAGCAQQCANALRQVHGDAKTHGLDADLDIAISKLATFVTSPREEKQTRLSESPMLINLQASEAGSMLRSTLAGWIRILHEETGGALPNDTLESMARWLVPACKRARHVEYGPEMVDEILAAVAEVHRVVDIPVRRIDLNVRCHTIIDSGEECEEELHAILAEGARNDGQIRCSQGHTTTVEECSYRFGEPPKALH